MKIGVIIPLYVSNTLTYQNVQKAVHSVYSTRHQLVFLPIENYIHPNFQPMRFDFSVTPDYMERIPGRQPQGTAKAWNDGIKRAVELGCDYILQISTDTILQSSAVDSLVEFAENNSQAVLWSPTQITNLADLEVLGNRPVSIAHNPYMAVFMVKNDFQEKMGLFDEHFTPVYFDDVDMITRIFLSGCDALRAGHILFYHYGSITLNTDADFKRMVDVNFTKLKQYFIKKWGRDVVDDAYTQKNLYFKHPFNDKKIGINEWSI